jgi:hypothetical protein
LVAGDFKPLAVAAAARSSSAPAEIGSATITAGLATLRLAEVSFSVVFLFAFGEWELCATLGTSDLYVWHF